MGQELDEVRAQIAAQEERKAAQEKRIAEATRDGTRQGAQVIIADANATLRNLHAERRRLEDAEEVASRQVGAIREGTERQLAVVRESAEQQAEAAREAAAEQLAHEERTFWFRRFFTTLGIAHAGAFFAMATGLAQADKPERVGPYLANAFAAFASGMVLSGIIPIMLMVSAGATSDPKVARGRGTANYLAFLLAIAASGAFLFGLAELIGFFRGLGASR